MIRRIRPLVTAALLGAMSIGAVSLVGCAAAARRPNTIAAGQLRTDPRLAEGQYVFMRHCNQCHVGGAAGVGPALNSKYLPGFLIRFKVRHSFGRMPSFSDRKISDSQLDDVIHYLKYLRSHPRRLVD